MKVGKILYMKDEQILSMLSEKELEQLDNSIIANRNHFCDLFQEGARLSGGDEYITPSEYLTFLLEDLY